MKRISRRRAFAGALIATIVIGMATADLADASSRHHHRHHWHKWHQRHIPKTTTTLPSTITTPAPVVTLPQTTTPTAAPATTTTVKRGSTTIVPTTKAPATTTTSAPTKTTPVSQTKNCAKMPSACGFPDATNTGVPAGTVLKKVPGQITSGMGWHYDSRGWIAVDTDGAVIDGIDTTVNVDVTASNVMIKNSRIHPSGDVWGVSLRHNVKNVKIQSNTIFGCTGLCNDRLMVGVRDIYSDATNIEVSKNNIYGTSSAVYIEDGVVKDNYIHDFGFKDGDHTNGFANGGTTNPLLISHNTIFNQFSQTDAIMLCHDFGTEANKTVDNNLLAGGGWTIYGGDTGIGNFKSHHIKITNNRIAKLFYPNGGAFGPIASFDSGAAGNVMTGNVWDDSGQPVS